MMTTDVIEGRISNVSLSDGIEFLIHYVREHPLVSVPLVTAFYWCFSFFTNPRNMVSPLLKGSLIIQINIPRVYASESSVFSRWTNAFRLIAHAKETTLKGYKMVLIVSARVY